MARARSAPASTTVWQVVRAAAVAGLATFVVSRAIRVPLTYDEAAAFLRYIAADPLSLFDFSVATNHLLNTLLTKLFSTLAGTSEVVLRMPSLIGYGLYLYFSLLILRRLTYRAIAIAAFLLLNVNPYLLDYFALSRGYGLSLGLLSGAIFFLLELVGDPEPGLPPNRHLPRALALATAAVMANFSLLNVYLAIAGIGLLAACVALRASPQLAGAPAASRRRNEGRRGYFVWGPAIVVAYTLLVFSQDFGLSDELYEPVAVRVIGVNDAALDTVRVLRIDRRGRTEPLQRHGEVWVLDRRDHFSGLRIELPAAAADEVGSIEVVAGNRAFRGRPTDGLWRRSDAGSTRTLESTGLLSLAESKVPAFRDVMNWAGDRAYAVHLAVRTGVVLSALAVLAVVLAAVGALAKRAGVLSARTWTPLSTSAWWIAALAGSPLYLLKRNGELYYGGESGLVQDTFHSLIEGSFYGQTYFANQADLVFAAVLATVVVFAIACGLSYRRGVWQRMLPSAVLLSIMAIVSAIVLAQRMLFGTPYLLGRTALFYIPLYLLFVAFTADALAGLGRPWRFAVTITLALAVSLSLYHVRASANVTSTLDWPRDAATRTMLANLAAIASPAIRPDSRVSLGVDWPFYPVAEFYARRAAIPIDVHVLPRPGGTDFLYLEDTHGDRSVEVLRRYRLARSVLARPAADAGRPADRGR